MRGEKQRGYFRHGKSRDALTSYLPANQRVASQARGPWSQSSVDLPPFWLRNSKLRCFSEYHHSSATQPMIHMVSPFILGFGGKLMHILSFKSFPGICGKVAWYYPTCVSHPRPQVSDEIAPYFFCSQSQWLVYGLRHIFQLVMSGRVEIRENWYIFNFILLGTLYEIVRK